MNLKTIKKTAILKLILIILFAFVIINNYLNFNQQSNQKVKLLAHRGLAQTFDIETVEWNTNTAAIIHKPEHPFIENTIPSIKISFEYGADIVEFDIRVSKDKKLVVFHDEYVDYRTGRKGRVSDYTLSELKQMDVGYGYTYDNGKTFPFRGKCVGMMPTFDEVISKFPDKEFLIHIKDDGDAVGELFLKKLDGMKRESVSLLSIYGNDSAITLIRSKYPDMKALSMRLIKKAALDYALIGWTGIIPGSMKNMEIHMPIEYARFFWGWPEKLVKRMDSVNTRFVIVKKKGKWSGGFDSKEDLSEIPKNYHGYIWTERIDRISEYMKNRD